MLEKSRIRLFWVMLPVLLGVPASSMSAQEAATTKSATVESILKQRALAKQVQIKFSCQREGSLTCRVVDDISNLTTKEVGIMMFATAEAAEKLKAKASKGELRVSDVRAHIRTSTIGLLPTQLEKNFAKSTVRILKSPSTLQKATTASKAGRLGAFVLLGKAAYDYLYNDQPVETGSTHTRK